MVCQRVIPIEYTDKRANDCAGGGAAQREPNQGREYRREAAIQQRLEAAEAKAEQSAGGSQQSGTNGCPANEGDDKVRELLAVQTKESHIDTGFY